MYIFSKFWRSLLGNNQKSSYHFQWPKKKKKKTYRKCSLLLIFEVITVGIRHLCGKTRGGRVYQKKKKSLSAWRKPVSLAKGFLRSRLSKRMEEVVIGWCNVWWVRRMEQSTRVYQAAVYPCPLARHTWFSVVMKKEYTFVIYQY